MWRRNPGNTQWTLIATRRASLSTDVSLQVAQAGLLPEGTLEVRDGATVLLRMR